MKKLKSMHYINVIKRRYLETASLFLLLPSEPSAIAKLTGIIFVPRCKLHSPHWYISNLYVCMGAVHVTGETCASRCVRMREQSFECRCARAVLWVDTMAIPLLLGPWLCTRLRGIVCSSRLVSFHFLSSRLSYSHVFRHNLLHEIRRNTCNLSKNALFFLLNPYK